MKAMKKTALLFAAVMLVSAVMAVTVFAQPLWQGIGKEKGYVRSFVEHGFALNGNEYHVLDVNVRILNRNNTQTVARTMGNIRFAGKAYALNITGYDNQSLSGDVLTLPPPGANKTGFNPTTVGHISLSMSKYEGEMLSNGTLTMNNTNFNVLLTSPVVTLEAGNLKVGFGSHNFNGTLRPHNFNGTVEPRNFNGALRPHNPKR